jgi:hypothetical protein
MEISVESLRAVALIWIEYFYAIAVDLKRYR